MKRQIIKIDERKCNGCGLCVSACNEGAIGIVNGKAKLLRDDYCDGLGNCLPVCPTGAISFEEREAKPFDAETVKERMKRLMNTEIKEKDIAKRFDTEMSETSCESNISCGCPGSAAKTSISAVSEKEEKLPRGCLETASKTIRPQENDKRRESVLPCGCPGSNSKPLQVNDIKKETESCDNHGNFVPSQLRQWPVQIKLVPVNAPYFENADLLIAADCGAFSCGDFHNKYIKGKITLVGCPKLDGVDYTEKLAAIIKNNNIKSVTVVRMEVPCCTGIANAALEAVKSAGKDIETKIITLSLKGEEI